MNNKVFTTAVIVALVSLGALGSARAQSTSPACNNKLIRGNFGVTIQGTKLAGPGPTGPQVGVAVSEYDGKGNFTQIDTVTIGGVVVADFTHTPATGTYTVNPDCTGTFTINFTDGRPTVTANFVVVDNGNEIDAVVTSAGGNPGILATSSVSKRRFTAQ
jgi:hypothetical protein